MTWLKKYEYAMIVQYIVVIIRREINQKKLTKGTIEY